MPETERPKSRLPNGKINPAYTKWRKAQKVAEKSPIEREIILGGSRYGKSQTPVAVMEAPAPVAAPVAKAPAEFLTLKCIKSAKNPKFVFCDLGGVKVAVRCKRGLSKNMPGKRIKVSVDNSGTTPIYTHIR